MKWWILVILKYFPCSSSPFPRPPTPRSWRSTLCKRATVWRRRCSSLLLSPMLFLGDKKVLNTPRMKSSWMSLRSWTSWYEQFLLLSFHRLLVMVPSLIVRLLVPFIWSAVCQACLNSSSVLFSLFSLSPQGLNDKVRFDLGEGSQKRKVGGSNGNNIDLEDVRFHQVYLHLWFSDLL